MATYQEIMAKITQQEEAAKAANLQRYEQAMAIYDEIISRYRPGGEFGKAALGQLEKRKVLDVGKETQQLISSGLYGTTTMGATGRRWEEAVGAPERLKLEDIQMQRLSEAQVGKAGFMERREDIGPDPSLVAQLSQQAGAAPQRQIGVQRTYGGTYGASSFPDMFSIAGEGGVGGAAPSGYTGQTVKGGGAPIGVQQYGGVPSTEGVSGITGGLSDAEFKKKYGRDPNSGLNVGGKTITFRAYIEGGGTHAAFGVKPAGSTQQTTATYKPPKYAAGYGSPTGKF